MRWPKKFRLSILWKKVYAKDRREETLYLYTQSHFNVMKRRRVIYGLLFLFVQLWCLFNAVL